MKKTIAYLRVSTDQQDLENQRMEIKSYADSKNLKIDKWSSVHLSDLKISKYLN